jgi:heterokaryon incompatibility protein (HET)
MMANSKFYSAFPLIPRSRKFRLLSIHPRQGNEEEDGTLHASLTVANVDREKGKFETISYVWGDKDLPKTTIFIDEVPIEITQSLSSVLCYLRQQNQVSRLWADAICINQDDFAEKTDQVRLMADIYRLCSQVNVWLADPGHQASVGHHHVKPAASLGGLRTLLSAKHFHVIPGFKVNERTGKLTFEENEEFRDLWHGFRLLDESTWWTRAWTAQEAFLPPKVVFLHNEAESCDIQEIRNGVDRYWNIAESPQQCCAEALDAFPKEKTASLWLFFQNFCKIHDRRDVRFRKRPPDGRDWFYYVVASLFDRDCSDPKDHLYSLWSLAGREYRHLSPNYDIEDAEVFTSVFKAKFLEAQSIKNHKWSWGMDFPIFRAFDFGSEDTGVRPSWVPDFNKLSGSSSCRETARKNFAVKALPSNRMVKRGTQSEREGASIVWLSVRQDQARWGTCSRLARLRLAARSSSPVGRVDTTIRLKRLGKRRSSPRATGVSSLCRHGT